MGFRKPKAIDIASDWGVWGLTGVYEAGLVDLKLKPPDQVREGGVQSFISFITLFPIQIRAKLCRARNHLWWRWRFKPLKFYIKVFVVIPSLTIPHPFSLIHIQCCESEHNVKQPQKNKIKLNSDDKLSRVQTLRVQLLSRRTTSQYLF